MWFDGARSDLAVSRKKLREMSGQESLDARQTYSTQKGKRKSPDIGDENPSPDFSMVLDLDRNFASTEGQLEQQKKAALQCLGQIGVSSRDQGSRSFAARPENRSASQNAANDSTNSMNRQASAMQQPAGDLDLVAESDPLGQRVETKCVVCDYHFLLDCFCHDRCSRTSIRHS
jgi:hypothetical protein